MCQRILAADANISAAGEPHILLPLLYALKDRGVYSEYDHKITAQAIKDFCQHLPDGLDAYFAEIRKTTLSLYEKTGDGSIRYFLDKTPLYHLIVEDIIRLFPEAKFIFVWRNPLAMVSSIMETWRAGGWLLYLYEIDLYRGLSNLVSAYQNNTDRTCAIRYEDLVLKPEETVQSIFSYLELPYNPEVLTKFQEVRFRSKIRDPYAHKQDYQTIRQDPLHKWKRIMVNPLRVGWCKRYLRWIGRERLAVMGYDFDTLMSEVNAQPFSLRFLSRDLYRIPYGKLYTFFEGRIMKQKMRALLAGENIYIHH